MSVSQQTALLKELKEHLLPQGKILIGDVAFETMEELDHCREISRDDWDDEEIYPVAEILRTDFPEVLFQKVSFCAGILILPAA